MTRQKEQETRQEREREMPHVGKEITNKYHPTVREKKDRVNDCQQK